MTDKRPVFPVGSNVFVIRNNMLLLGRRIKNNNQWGLPAGHVEEGEGVLETAERELQEETGMTAERFEFTNFVNDCARDDNGHYVHLGVLAVNPVGEPRACEPEVCAEWKFFPLDELPDDIFFGHIKLINNYKKGVVFADA